MDFWGEKVRLEVVAHRHCMKYECKDIRNVCQSEVLTSALLHSALASRAFNVLSTSFTTREENVLGKEQEEAGLHLHSSAPLRMNKKNKVMKNCERVLSEGKGLSIEDPAFLW